MSTKINLEIKTEIDLEFLSAGVYTRLIRLFAFVQLQTTGGWTRRYKAIVDTGNPFTIIPYFIWKQAYVEWLIPKTTQLYGIGTGSIQGKLANITLVFSDEKQISQPLKLKAYLSTNDTTPFLLGFEDLLTSVKLVSDYKSHQAYLEW